MDPVFYPHCDDGTLQGSNLEHTFRIFDRAMTANGRDLKVARNYKQWLIEAGFVDVVEEVAPGPGKFDVDLFISSVPSQPWRSLMTVTNNERGMTAINTECWGFS